ncbi:hypothetical protein FRC16_000044 [Serendipita sp. 398]|nr:hypothetical protein FRC16_000044 [Serendipita sp. 398]
MRRSAVLHEGLGLPVELWRIILELALREVRDSYKFCSYKTFSQLQSSLRDPDCPHVSPLIEVWKIVRLVCRTWRRLAGPQFHLVANSPEMQLKGGIEEIVVRGGIDQLATLLNFSNYRTQFTQLTALVLCDGDPGNTKVDAAISFLLDRAVLIKSLRALSIAPRSPPTGFWGKLQRAFPDLVTLSVAHPINQSTMIFSMRQLEVFDFKLWQNRYHRDVKISLPSLKHLALRGPYQPSMNDFIIKHGHQLESCLFEETPWSQRALEETTFWSTVPNLRLFGLSLDMNPVLKGPPRDYPLRHIRISGSSLHIRRVHQFVEHFSQVSHVFINASSLQNLEEAKMIQSLKEMGLFVTEIVEGRFTPTASKAKEMVVFFSALALYVAYIHLFIA